MTNGITDALEACSVEELTFWEFDLPAQEMMLRDAPPVQVYDLKERTSRFGEQIIIFAKKIPWSPISNRLVDQLVGAGTSVGANYCEADDGVSRADFKHRISISRKEIAWPCLVAYFFCSFFSHRQDRSGSRRRR